MRASVNVQRSSAAADAESAVPLPLPSKPCCIPRQVPPFTALANPITHKHTTRHHGYTRSISTTVRPHPQRAAAAPNAPLQNERLERSQTPAKAPPNRDGERCLLVLVGRLRLLGALLTDAHQARVHALHAQLSVRLEVLWGGGVGVGGFGGVGLMGLGLVGLGLMRCMFFEKRELKLCGCEGLRGVGCRTARPLASTLGGGTKETATTPRSQLLISWTIHFRPTNAVLPSTSSHPPASSTPQTPLPKNPPNQQLPP